MFAIVVKLFSLALNLSLFREPGPPLRLDQHNRCRIDLKGVSTGYLGDVFFI
jgi:hypothetical protein